MGEGKQEKRLHKKNNSINSNAKGQQNSGDESLLASYMSAIRGLIIRNKYKSPLALKLGLRGVIKIGFIIRKPNKIEQIKILEESQFDQLNKSALMTIETLSDIPFLPKELNLNEISAVVDITYQ